MVRSHKDLRFGHGSAWLKVVGSFNEFRLGSSPRIKTLDLGRGGIGRLSVLTGLPRNDGQEGSGGVKAENR